MGLSGPSQALSRPWFRHSFGRESAKSGRGEAGGAEREEQVTGDRECGSSARGLPNSFMRKEAEICKLDLRNSCCDILNRLGVTRDTASQRAIGAQH